MQDNVASYKEKLKNLILASLLLNSNEFERITALIDGMSESQLEKVEKLFWKAEQRRREILYTLAVSDIDVFEQGVQAVTEKVDKNLRIKNMSSFGREIFKKTLKK